MKCNIYIGDEKYSLSMGILRATVCDSESHPNCDKNYLISFVPP